MSDWISVKDRLPDKSGHYLCAHNGCISCLAFSQRHKLFNSYDSFREKEAKRRAISVTHWMPIPEPPKEETT